MSRIGKNNIPLIPQGNTLPELISGLVENVLFHNEETGFTVLKAKIKERRDPVTIVCTLASINVGEWITAEGYWQRDKNYGLQFKATAAKITPPTTIEGIEKYLGSGLIKGIGPIYAKKMVDKFGERVIEIIENQSAKLEEIDGIGPGRRKKIKEAWESQKTIRNIMLFLYSHGVGTSRAVRIYKTYGERAIDIIRENPYRLAIDIPGIGFKTADKIARNIGIPPDSILRACACINHILIEATSDGHCALPEPLLKKNAAELLQINDSIIQDAIEKSVFEHQIERQHINEETFIYLPTLKQAEEIVASKICNLLKSRQSHRQIDSQKAIEWYEKKYGKILADEQKEAIINGLENRILIITGGPGVGKTTVIHALVSILVAKKIKCLLCAPTGRAAKRLSEVTGFEAKTIHRLLEIIPQTGSFLHNEKQPLECDFLIVDETSMVDILLMSHLLRALPQTASLILVGDADQLPSVGPGNLLNDLIDSQLIPVVRLKKIFRQSSQSNIVTIAHQINKGIIPKLPAKNEISDFYFIHRDDPQNAVDLLIELVSKRIPEKFGYDPIRDIQVLCPMHRGILGIQEINKRLQDILNPLEPQEPAIERFGWQFRLRDKVMQVQNNYEKGVYNGDIGQIAQIDLVEKEVVVRFENKEIVYDFDELDEILPAYATTIHKAQGCEFPVVIIPIAMQQYALLQRNLIYTAITRGKKLVIIIGQKKAFYFSIKNNKTTQRFSGLLNKITTYAKNL
ncbi:MAG: SF1B family DNA helicase RecD2 [Verrucomicrobiia bacterium]